MRRLISTAVVVWVIAALAILSPPSVVKGQVPMTGAGLGAPSSGGGSATWTATGNPAAQNTGTITATFSGVAIGSPGANDVIVALANSQSSNATLITCNGNNMTMQAHEETVISGLQIWSITASSCGVTGQASTTFVFSNGGAGAMNNQNLQVGKMVTTTPTPTNTGAQTTGASISVTVPSNGVAIVASYLNAGTVTSWSGGTQDFGTTDASSGTMYLVHATATGSVTASPDPSGHAHYTYAAWSP